MRKYRKYNKNSYLQFFFLLCFSILFFIKHIRLYDEIVKIKLNSFF